jgi:hypothetical protein
MDGNKERIKLTTEEAVRVGYVARSVADKLICQETLRLALPIVRLAHEMITADYKRIKGKYGGYQI